MILTNILEKIKGLPDLPRNFFFGCVLGLFVLGAFMLSRISIAENQRMADLRITSTNPNFPPSSNLSPSQAAEVVFSPPGGRGGESKGVYVASKTGKTYHLPWCSGAKRIKEENKVWFMSKIDAENAGYLPASNCHGI